MSEPIPESIPTSADPRSKRPLKKRALSPRSQTASQLEALFAKPDQDLKISSSTSSSTALASHNNSSAPPEIVANVQGSSAGAGSGEFHVYKASRRREYERLRQMDEEVRSEKEGEEWEREKREREERDREKTRKNREKRERLKNKKGKKGGEAGAGGKTGELENGGVQRVRGIKARAIGDAGVASRADKEAEEVAAGEEPVGVIIHDED